MPKGGRWAAGPYKLLIPALVSLALFAWLLTLHPTATGRVYAAYGGVYIGIAILWLWLVDGVRPTTWDLSGGGGGRRGDDHHHAWAAPCLMIFVGDETTGHWPSS